MAPSWIMARKARSAWVGFSVPQMFRPMVPPRAPEAMTLVIISKALCRVSHFGPPAAAMGSCQVNKVLSSFCFFH